jgi:V-type H+-transporting ATPase 21kDa proteolipid subunit
VTYQSFQVWHSNQKQQLNQNVCFFDVMASNGVTACTTYFCNGDWNEVLSNISPYSWAYMGIAIGLSASILGAAWGIWLTGSSLTGASVKAPRIRSKNLVSIIFCEATAIYGVILAIILLSKIDPPKDKLYTFSENWDWATFYYAGYSVFFSGCTVGLTNIASGVAVGIAGSSCALADAQEESLFVKCLIIEIFASALGIFGIIVGIILSNNAQFPVI